MSHENGSTDVVTLEPEEAMDRRAAGAALAVREAVGGLLQPVARVAEVIEAQEAVRELVARALKSGRDYMRIPGTEKDTLLQPGAERMFAAFGCQAEFTVVEREVDHDRPVKYVKRSWEWHPTERGKKIWSEEPGESVGLYRYVVRCDLVHRATGVIVGTGIGSCSTMESKYIDRPRDLENTVLKMAKKRAMVDAVLTTFGLHDQFTQDVEDLPEDVVASRDTAGPFSLEDRIGFGKHKGRTWAELLEEERGYVEWAVEKMQKLTDEAREALREALKGQKPAPRKRKTEKVKEKLQQRRSQQAEPEQADLIEGQGPSQEEITALCDELAGLMDEAPDMDYEHMEAMLVAIEDRDPELIKKYITECKVAIQKEKIRQAQEANGETKGEGA